MSGEARARAPVPGPGHEAGLDLEGTTLIAEPRDEGILLRPAAVLPLETCSPRRKAEFLLSNAVDAEDYEEAVRSVRELGLDPEEIPHEKPAGA